MKKQNLTIFMFILMLVAMFLVSRVHAAQDVHGKGVLKAMGNGVAMLKGTMKLRVAGDGFLLVDPGESAACPLGIDIQGRGERVDLEDGRILYVGFKGLARIEGCAIRVKMAGSRIDLIAVGNGRAILEGCGRFHTRKVNGAWHMPGEIIFGHPADAVPLLSKDAEAENEQLLNNPFLELLEGIR